MTCFHCRPLSADDLPAVLTLDQTCFGGLWSQSGYQRELESPNSDLLVLATASSPPQGQASGREIIGVGCLWSILDEAHITLLAIAPPHRRQGLGQWLFVHLLRCACDRGLTYATLEVRESNQPAQALYARYGFQTAGQRRKYYPDGENALILWRSGLQDATFQTTLQGWIDSLTDQLQQHGWCPLPELSLKTEERR